MLRDGELVGGMGATVVQEPEIQAVGEGLGEQIDAELEVLRVQRGPCQTEALSAGGRPRAIDREPCEDMLARPDGRHPTGSEAPPAHRQQANAAFLLAQDPNGAAVLYRDETLEWLMTGGLTRLQRLGGFWCGAAGGP